MKKYIVIIASVLTMQMLMAQPDVGIFGVYTPSVIEVGETSALTVQLDNNSFTDSYPVGEVFVQVTVPIQNYTVIGVPTGSLMTYFPDLEDNDGDGVWFAFNSVEIPAATASETSWSAEFTVQGDVEVGPNANTLFATGFDNLDDEEGDDNNNETGLEVTSVLPVEITFFDVRGTDCAAVGLEWETAQETNNAGFEIQRTLARDVAFEKVGFVAGAGDSKEALQYKFKDDISRLAERPEVIYYRLKQYDLDGRYDYSDIITVQVECEEVLAISGYPNPVINDFNIEVTGLQGANTVAIFNGVGQLVTKLVIPRNSFNTVDMSNYENGVYTVNVLGNSGEVVKSMKVIKIAN